MKYLTPEHVDFDNYQSECKAESDVRPAWMYEQVVTDYFNGKLGNAGATLPWGKTHHDVKIRPGEVTIWTGRNFSGKSQFVGQVMLGCIQQGQRVCIASMEMKPHTTLHRMVRQAAGGSNPPDEYVRAFFSWTGENLWMYDQQGSLTPQRILGVARYCGDGVKSAGKRLKVNHLVIDSLMKCGIANDDYTRQKEFVNELCTIAMDTNMHIHLVVHQKKDGDENTIGDRYSVKGASEITDQADNTFLIWRNRRKEREEQLPIPQRDSDIMQEHDAVMRCDKQRHGEFSGDFSFWFNKESMQFVSGAGLRPIEFFPYSAQSREAYA
jgi:twinkle protein